MIRFDEIGYWSEVKLDIVRDYASAYSAIIAAQRNPNLHHVYIDAFAGAGVHISRKTGEFVTGSPLNALNVKPPFRTHYLIDIEQDKIASLRALVGHRPDVQLLSGGCNSLLLERVFPEVEFRDFRRGLCLLDPYACISTGT